MAVAEAVPTYDKLIYCIVVFFLDFSSGVQQIVSQRVKLGEVHSQVGDLQLVCREKDAKFSTAVAIKYH